MAREITGPLTADDITWLQARYSEGYVARMVELHGTKGKKAEQALQASENGPESAEDGVDGGSAPEDSSDGSEDLIGVPNTGDVNALDLVSPATANPTPFDPASRNVEEVVAYLKDASDEEKSRVLALEAEGKARSGVLNA